MEKILVASSNENKIKEIKQILKEYEILSLKDIAFFDEIVEDGETFEENALIKALAVNKKTNLTVLSDDSGLCVDYLGGAPGVYSARYSGEDKNYKKNNEKLLKELKDVKEEKRGAKFVSAVAIVFEDGSQEIVRGETFGKIGFKEEGEFGFGYDPLFIDNETKKTYAQMNKDEKNKISHRQKAFMKANEILKKRKNEKNISY